MSFDAAEKSPRPTVETVITDLAFDGRSVGQLDGKVTFFNAGLPGEKVRAEITRRKPRYNFARVTDILEKSPYRIAARCRHFEICGGCTWQDLAYEQQLYYKREQVRDCLHHLGRLDDIPVAETVGAAEQFYYRNKMEFSLNVSEGDAFVLGLHRRGHFDQIFDIEECLLQSERSNRMAGWFRDFLKRHRIPVYDVTRHTGLVRFLVIREGKRTGQLMLNVVTASDTFPMEEELVAEAGALFPEITTIVQNINGAKSNIARGESEKVLFGPGYIEERVFEFSFRIYANSFFQTNSYQAERLYEVIFELLQPSPKDNLLDLYCGTGAIGICVSPRVERVMGIELETSAVQAARENAARNGMENISFEAGSVQDYLRDHPEVFKGISGAIIDPPRAGMHPRALREVMALDLPRFVYVSCNPASFARDAALLVRQGYKLGKVIPVDMFPHTMHIELVADFQK